MVVKAILGLLVLFLIIFLFVASQDSKKRKKGSNTKARSSKQIKPRKEESESEDSLVEKNKESTDKVDVDNYESTEKDRLIRKYNETIMEKELTIERAVTKIDQLTHLLEVSDKLNKQNEQVIDKMKRYKITNRVLEQERFKQSLNVLSEISYTIQKDEELYDLAKRSYHLTPAKLSIIKADGDFNEISELNSKYGSQGVYIIHNKNKDKYYVGKSENIIDSSYSHFNKSGDYDIYADYVYNDDFVIRLIFLEMSDYITLNALQRDYIAHYNSIEYGYNKQELNS